MFSQKVFITSVSFSVILGILIGIFLYNILFFSSGQIFSGVFGNIFTSQDALRVQEVIEIVNKNFEKDHYTQEKPTAELFIEQFVDSLGDPHSQFFNKKDSQLFLESIEGKFVGIGAYVDEHPKGLLVDRVMKGSPAETSGLIGGDVIIRAGEKDLEGLPSDESLNYVRGEEGTQVEIEVERGEAKKRQIFIVTRKQIDIPSVEVFQEQDGIERVVLMSFDENAALELRDVFEKIQNTPTTQAVILDLRQNGGGILDEAVNILSLFFSQGTPLVKVKETGGDEQVYYTLPFTKNILTKPLVVLIDEYSASASEVTAGVLQEYNRAIVVGQVSYGKGSVQQIFPLLNESSIKLTIAHWFTPKDAPIDGKGVTPDVVVGEKEEIITEKVFNDQTKKAHEIAIDLVQGKTIEEVRKQYFSTRPTQEKEEQTKE